VTISFGYILNCVCLTCTVVVLNCFVMCGCVYVWVLQCVLVLEVCLLIFTVLCIVCTVFLYFFYVYVFLLVLSVLPPSDNSIAVNNNNNDNNNERHYAGQYLHSTAAAPICSLLIQV
jgi:hypothetical protein